MLNPHSVIKYRTYTAVSQQKKIHIDLFPAITYYKYRSPHLPRACLKNHSCNLHAPLCGIFCPNSVAVARYGALIRTKSPTNCDAHLAESLFQTRSRACLKKVHDVKDASAFLSFMYLFY